MLSAGSIVRGGFSLLRERPGAVFVWAALYFAAVLAMSLAMRPFVEAQAAMSGGDVEALMANMRSLGWQMLIQLAFFVAFCVLFTAALRAALRPEEGGFAFIRFGGDELRIIGLSIFLLVCFYIALLLAAVVMTLFAVLIGAVGGMAAAATAGVVEILALIGIIVWLEVRLSLAAPLTFIRKSFVLAESWRLTRGRFWPLFGGYFVIVLILMVLWIGVATVTLGPYVSELMRSGLTRQALQAAAQHQMARQFAFNATALIGAALTALVGGFSLALFGGAVAAAARELALDRDGMTTTFS